MAFNGSFRCLVTRDRSSFLKQVTLSILCLAGGSRLRVRCNRRCRLSRVVRLRGAGGSTLARRRVPPRTVSCFRFICKWLRVWDWAQAVKQSFMSFWLGLHPRSR